MRFENWIDNWKPESKTIYPIPARFMWVYLERKMAVVNTIQRDFYDFACEYRHRKSFFSVMAFFVNRYDVSQNCDCKIRKNA